jgi:WD40 repeat protein
MEDNNDCITNVSISPSISYIAGSNENSTIYLQKLKVIDKIDDDLHDSNMLNSKMLFNNNNNFHELIGGHSKSVYKTKFTHDSKYLLSAGADSTVCLWDVEKESLNVGNIINHKNVCSPLVCTYSGHMYPIWDIDVFSNLNLFITASKDKTARLWSFDRLYPLRVYASHQSDVDCVAFHPNGAYLATGSSDRTIRFWSVHSGDCLRLFSRHNGSIYSVCFSPDGQYLASAGEDQVIKIWNIKTGTLFKELKGHTDVIYALEFDNSSSILCSGGLDKTVKFWNFNKSSESVQDDEQSNELIYSINLNFNVHNVYCDLQNVFYSTGVMKKVRELNIKMNDSLSESPSDVLSNNKILKTKLPVSQISNQMSTRRSSATNHQTIINTNSNLSNTSSSILFNNEDDLYEF